MSDQLSIDFQARSRRTDPATSHEAAARISGSALAAKVLECLRIDGAATSHEIAARLGLSLVTVSPRMKPLEIAGKVERDGRRDGRTIWRAR